MKYWPHQDQAHEECRKLFAAGVRRWCMVAPCGAGKSVMMRRITVPAAAAGKRVALYSYRVMLTGQMVSDFEKTGAEFGVVASGFGQYRNPAANIQICSLQTVHSRVTKSTLELPEADIVIVDEAHQQSAEMAKQVFKLHHDQGARIIGFTATPVDLGGIYQQLVTAGTYEQMRDCNAHLPIRCYGPDRPDLSQCKPMKGGDFSSNTDRKINRVPTIIGRVYDYWQKLNPAALPALGFAPGVAESKWFVDEFLQRGVPCAHIDAERVVLVEKNSKGELIANEYPTDDSSRQAVLEGSRLGHFKIVWNRFVLREAIDMPWLYHAISATSMGALSTCLQSVGRVMRYWPEYRDVIWQDHGGNIDRHGTPDVEREWVLGCTNTSVHREEVRQREKQKGDEAEPICCPKCCAYRTHGPQCPSCGYMHKRSVRMVRELDGQLVRKTGRQVKYKAPKTFDDYFRSAIYGAFHNGQTVKQAYSVAVARAKQNGVEAKPQGGIPLPATGDPKWHRSVRKVYPSFRPKQLQGGAA